MTHVWTDANHKLWGQEDGWWCLRVWWAVQLSRLAPGLRLAFWTEELTLRLGSRCPSPQQSARDEGCGQASGANGGPCMHSEVET